MIQIEFTTDNGTSYYHHAEGSFLTLEQYVVAVMQGILSTGSVIHNVKIGA